MKLYEVDNGFMGESDVRVYVLAESEEQALALARARYKAEWERRPLEFRHNESYYTTLTCELLLDDLTTPMCTAPSDCGWETER